jgi:hypothetical protein
MEFRRAGEALLRSPQIFLNLIPSTSIQSCRCPIGSFSNFQTSKTPQLLSCSYRYLTTTNRVSQQASAPFEPPSSDNPQQHKSELDDLSRQIDSLLDFTPYNRSNTGNISGSTRPNSSADEASNAYRNHSRNRDFGANFSPLPRRNKPGLDIDRMEMPASSSDVTTKLPPALSVAQKSKYPRLDASTGRSIDLDPSKGRDLVRGLGQLNSLLARNKVRADFNKQRFHERPGLKRKRLKSQRWRKRFKEGFREVVGRVSALTRKGW